MKTLNLIDKAFLLKKTTLFGSLDLDLLLTISDKLEIMTCQAGETIFASTQDGNRMYLIVEGEVLIENPHGEPLAKLTSGEFFGDESVFNEKPRTYNAKSLSAARLLSLSRNHLLGIIAECPSVAVALLESYSANVEFRKRPTPKS